jgi:hypothetical protein
VSLEFLSDDWLEEADRRSASLPVVPHLDTARIVYSSPKSEFATWSQVVEDGRLQWHRGAVTDRDVEVVWTRVQAFNVLSGAWDANTATANTTIVETRVDGRYVGPPPPMDIGRQREVEDLPPIPGATLRLGCECTDGPFGTTTFTLDFRDGRFVSARRGIFEGTDLALRVPFTELMALRQGLITVIDAIAAGDVAGSQGALMLMAGIAESAEYQRVMKAAASGNGSVAFAALGQIVRADAYRATMAELFAATASG